MLTSHTHLAEVLDEPALVVGVVARADDGLRGGRWMYEVCLCHWGMLMVERKGGVRAGRAAYKNR